MTTYAAGLRLNEVLHLRVTDIDSARMTIRVEQGKGGKDRYTVLPRRLLETLRGYWKRERPTDVAVSLAGDRTAAASHRAPTRVWPGEAARRHHETRGHSRAAPCVRDASARSRRRPAHDSTACSATGHQHDDALLAVDASHGDGAGLAARSARAVRAAAGLARVRRADGHGRLARGSPARAGDIVRAYGDAYRRTPPTRAGPARGAARDRDVPDRRARRPSGDV